MSPEQQTEQKSADSTVISNSHKISLNVHYDEQVENGKLGGSLTPVEERMATTGAIPMTSIKAYKLHKVEETERASVHSGSTLNGTRPSTPDTHSTQSDLGHTPKLYQNGVKSTVTASTEYLNGPDQIVATDAIKTWHPDGAVRLKIGTKGKSAMDPISVPTLLKNGAQNYSSMTAMSVKRDDRWIHYTYTQYYETVRTVAKAFIHLGLEMYHGVCILGFNSPEWFIADLATIFAGGFAAGIYTTNSSEACQHCAINCKAQIWVVEDQKQLDKVLKIKPNLPHLKTIIQYIGTPTVEGVLSWNEVVEVGRKLKDTELQERLNRITINQCCTLIYTSGTTGDPKGVMLSHDNLTFTVRVNADHIGINFGKEVIVSYLPLSHIAAQMADIYLSLYGGTTVVFAQPDALKGSLINTLKEARPTRFLGVPRVWEKIYEKMMEVGRKTTGVKKKIATWAKSVGTETNIRRQNQDFSKPFGYGIANAVVYSKVKATLGLDRCLTSLSGAAPIAPEVISYFHSLDICLTEIYGMSESTGPHTVGLVEAFKVGSVGKTVPACYTLLMNTDQEGNGEICMGGRNVCMGYLLMEEKTHEAIDDDGWLHSGDIGRLDKDGFLYITGRIKELIITAGGENIPPVLIEDNLKAELPCISNAMLIGDKRKFLSILLTMKVEMDSEGEPLDGLASATLQWCQNIGSSAKTIQDVLAPDESIMKAIEAGIAKVNKMATSNAQKVQKFKILAKDFTVNGDELGPTLKLKRPVVMKKYKDVIEQLYE